jgi:hypothetical protein
MTDFDPVEFGRAVGETIREAVAPLVKRIEQLEARAPEPGPPGDPGKDAEPVDVAALVEAAVAKLLASDRLETLADLKATEAVAKHFETNPVRHGRDGTDGNDGANATDEQVSAAVKQYLAANPPEPGKPGRDGLDVKDLFRAEGGRLIAVLSDGTVKDLGVFVGRDGADGLSFEDFTGEYVAERGFVLRASRGEVSREFVLPYMVHRGFWSEGKQAKAGESMTHDGALWIAKRETRAKPCLENADDWILAARKGRDGQDGKHGIDKTKPVKVGSDA